MRPDGRLLSVNIAHVQPNPYKTSDVTGIDKRPTLGPVAVTAPGRKDSAPAVDWRETRSAIG